MNVPRQKIYLFLIRGFLASLFLWSALQKLMRIPGGPTLYDAMISHGYIPFYLIPAIEIGFAVWLLSGIWPRIAATGTVVLLSIFIGLIASEITQSHPLPCRCFGAAAPLYEPAVIRNELMLGLARNLILMLGVIYIFLASRPIEIQGDKIP